MWFGSNGIEACVVVPSAVPGQEAHGGEVYVSAFRDVARVSQVIQPVSVQGKVP
jgi:hypothetical protein